MDKLNTSQREAIKKLAAKTASLDLEEFKDDHILRMWLVANKYNVDKAHQNILKTLEWRKSYKINEIIDWEAPEVLQKYYPIGMSGHDKEGCPVWIIPHGGTDIKGLLQSASKNDYVRYTIRTIELSKREMKRQSEIRGTKVNQQLVIFDLDNFSLSNFTWKPSLDVTIQSIQSFERHYPEVLKCAIVINAPKVFSIAFSMIKPFLDDETVKKIQIHGKTGWKEVIQTMVSPDQLPKHWGGEIVDPDGNPKCPSKICLGGDVPKSYYTKNQSNKEKVLYKNITVPKGSCEALEYKVDQIGTKLKWSFTTDNYDIEFRIDFKSEEGKEVVEVVPQQRVNSHLTKEEGCIECEKVGIYIVQFDNTFSYLRSKSLSYSIELVEL